MENEGLPTALKCWERIYRRFDLTDLEQRRLAFHHTNLQPLWASDNWEGWTLRRSRDDASQGRTRIGVKYWEIIADNLSRAGWSWGCVAAIDSNGRTIFVADAHRHDGFVCERMKS